MNITVLALSNNSFSLSGACPHCDSNSVFIAITSVYSEGMPDGSTIFCAGMQCQGCRKFIFAIAGRQRNASTLDYVTHYPVGNPDDSVDKDVPENIASDFAEALRCQWVGAFKATVAMCRRSIEASCADLGATGKNLYEKIDNLAKQGKITEPLKQMAHRVRLTANRELHGKADDLDSIIEKDAEAIIRFTREYFYHVYVMPALLKEFEEPAAEAESSTEN